MVPADLRERPLTKAAQAIVASGDEDLIEAIRKVSPRLFADYTRGLPSHDASAPTLAVRRCCECRNARRRSNDARQRERHGSQQARRDDLKAADFTVTENNQPRKVTGVVPAARRLIWCCCWTCLAASKSSDFIRKAGRNFSTRRARRIASPSLAFAMTFN
jgi:hypothetical protein